MAHADVCICLAATLELKTEKTNAHYHVISSVGYNHDGTKIVSACAGGAIKVWDSGMPNCPKIAFPDPN